MLQKITQLINKYKNISAEAIRYIVIGVMTTLVNFSLFALMTRVFRLDVTVSNVTSIAVSIIFAFVTNKLVVFRHKSKTRAELATEFVKFVGARLLTMALEIGFVFLAVEVLKQNDLIGKLASQVLVIIGNYFISKFLVFRSKTADFGKGADAGEPGD